MDNCPGATVVGVRDDGAALNDPYPVGLTIITWTVTDAAGNSVSCKQKVQVSDKEAPKITCPEDIVVNNDLGECFATVDPGEPTVSDNCPGVTFKGTRSDGKELTDPYPVGTTTITWVARCLVQRVALRAEDHSQGQREAEDQLPGEYHRQQRRG
ncbi:MAG: hypothetical protein O3B01_23190 [Planctomycetota bacterium]|nr:hypothetical protein [Planctomycetota bacterium]